MRGCARLPGVDDVTVPMPTAADEMYHEYRVTITPHQKSANFDVKISVKGSMITVQSPLRQFYVSLWL